MPNLIFIKPKHGRMVPMPLYLCPPGRPDMLVPQEGISVIEDAYWWRRMQDDDIEVFREGSEGEIPANNTTKSKKLKAEDEK